MSSRKATQKPMALTPLPPVLVIVASNQSYRLSGWVGKVKKASCKTEPEKPPRPSVSLEP